MARYNLSYNVHPYSHSVLGTLEDIVDMPNEFEYSREFFERFYSPDNVVMQVYGDVDVDEAMGLIEQYWGSWEAGEKFTQDIPQEPARDESLYRHIEWPEASTPWFSLDFSASNFTITEPDTAALDIIQYMVFSSQSDLYKYGTKDRGIYW